MNARWNVILAVVVIAAAAVALFLALREPAAPGGRPGEGKPACVAFADAKGNINGETLFRHSSEVDVDEIRKALEKAAAWPRSAPGEIVLQTAAVHTTGDARGVFKARTLRELAEALRNTGPGTTVTGPLYVVKSTGTQTVVWRVSPEDWFAPEEKWLEQIRGASDAWTALLAAKLADDVSSALDFVRPPGGRGISD